MAHCTGDAVYRHSKADTHSGECRENVLSPSIVASLFKILFMRHIVGYVFTVLLVEKYVNLGGGNFFFLPHFLFIIGQVKICTLIR